MSETTQTIENQDPELAAAGQTTTTEGDTTDIPRPPGHETEAAIEKEKRDAAAAAEGPKLDQDDLETFFRKQFGLDRQHTKKRGKDKTAQPEGTPEGQQAKGESETTGSDEQSAGKSAQEGSTKRSEEKPQEPPSPPTAPEEDIEERLAEIAARAAAKLADQKKQEDAAKTEPKPSPETEFISKLDEVEQRRIQVLKKLEELYPKKYSGLSQRYVKSLMEAERLAAQWEAENPGQVWRDEDHEEELQEIAARHGITWDDEEYNEALIELKAEEKLQKLSEQIEKRLIEKQKREAELQKTMAEAAATTDATVREALEEIQQALSDLDVDLELYTEDGVLNKAKLDKLAEDDPIAYRTIIGTLAGGLAPATMEVVQIWRGLKTYDPNDKLHKWLDDFIISKEKEIAALPKEKRLFEGKDFAPLEKYYAMPPEQRAKYWTLREEDIILMLRHHFAGEAQKAYKTELEIAQRWFEKRANKAKNKNKGEAEPPPKPPQAHAAKETQMTSPTTVSVPRGASKKAASQASPSDLPEEFIRMLFGE
jgi:hypothetical protein